VNVLFFDTSAIVKRYVNETGSAWVDTLVDPTTGNLIYLARITGVEVVSAITRRQRAGGISAPDAALMLTDFRHDFANDYLKIEIIPSRIAHAMSLAENHALRGYDAVQLACALRARAQSLRLGRPFTMISADAALNAAAVAEGLSVDDPNTHP
jgi:predicted nucleic acid-binding protein